MSEPGQSSEAKQGISKIPPQVRVMIALCASPTLMVIAFFVYNMALQQWQEIGISTVIFTLIGLFAYYIVLTGRIPFRTTA